MKKLSFIIGNYIIISYAIIGFGRTLYVIKKKYKRVGVNNV